MAAGHILVKKQVSRQGCRAKVCTYGEFSDPAGMFVSPEPIAQLGREIGMGMTKINQPAICNFEAHRLVQQTG